jgi:hypothetical protein
MTSEIPRTLDLANLIEKKSAFLFGPRSTGKTSLIHRQLDHDAFVLDLLSAAVYLPLSQERILAPTPTQSTALVDVFQSSRLRG